MKKYLLGVIALALAMGFSAFTTDFHGKRDTTYFKYTSMDPQGYTDTANWEISSTPLSDCSGGNATCTVSSDEITSKLELVTYLTNVHTDPQSSVLGFYEIQDDHHPLDEQ